MEYADFKKQYDERLPALEEFRGRFVSHVESAFDSVPRIDRFSCRIKDAKSAYKKYLSKYSGEHDPLSHFEDLVAARFIVFFLSDVSNVRDLLLEEFNRVERSEKKPEFDDQFGYESEHLVLYVPPHLKPSGTLGFCPNTIEVQIRTILMHAYAEPQHDIGYKGGDLPGDTKRRLAWIAASCWGADREFEEIWRMVCGLEG